MHDRRRRRLRHDHAIAVGAPARHVLSLAGLALIATISATPSTDAEPPSMQISSAGIIIAGGSGPPVVLTESEIARLPAERVAVSFKTAHGQKQASFEGPLLWTVLDRAGVVDPAKPKEEARQFVLVTGRDGYKAVLALGEIAPAFEGKQVILAERMNGKPLGPEHLHLVMPGDNRGGRSVRDVASITVAVPPPGR